jgi:predicted metal-binding membrane protein
LSVGDRVYPITVALVAVTAFAWAFVIWTTGNMSDPLVRLMMPETSAWSLLELFWVWVMWAVMMVAMMLPSAAPMALTFHRVANRRKDPGSTFHFVTGYLLVWIVFSILATVLQGRLQAMGLLSRMQVLNPNWLAGGLLVLAGLFQWSALKHRCLTACRTPIGFLATHWRPGQIGALSMGLRHGAYCLGCCWALMALLFVFGVMNLVAVVAIATLVAFEKLLPHGDWLSKIGGVVLMVWGVLVFQK